MESLQLLLYNFIALTCALAFAYVTWAILNWVWLTPKILEKHLRQQGLNGNPYKMLFGDIKENARMTKEITSKPMPLSNHIWPRLFPIFHQALKDHGKNCFVWFGPTPGLNVTDPKLVKEVLTKKKEFQKPKMHPLIKLLLPGLADHDGEKWAKHRKIISPAFHMEKLKLMVPMFYTSCVEMLSRWDDLVSKDGLELDVWPYIQALTIDAISRTAFGSNYREGRTIFELQQEQSQLVIESLKSICIPGYRFLPTKKNNRMKAINNIVNSSLLQIINERVKAIKEGETSKNDLLGILLDSNLKEIRQHSDKTMGMTMDDIIEECKLFYMAGQEPTSALLVWTMILLSWNQEWQHRARCEVLQVFGNDTPNFEVLNHLKVVTMILYEVLRLYSPIVAMNRTVHEETKLGDISIPAGTLLFLPTMLLHCDPDIWGEDANEFNPERFADGVSRATKDHGLGFFPFSFGPRVCIGKTFAMLEAKMALAMIIKQFSFELSPSYAHAPFSILTVQPQYGARLILHKL